LGLDMETSTSGTCPSVYFAFLHDRNLSRFSP
jgi:hypothetical protein